MMNKIIVTLLLLLTCWTAPGQNPEEHKPKTYESPDGKLWWNKSLPVYINLSASPDEQGHLLKSQIHKKYTNPFYFDTEGINYIRSNWAVDKETKKIVQPKVTLLFEVYADGSAPKTKASISASKRSSSGKDTYYGENVKISLKAHDKFSGVYKTFYSLDGKPFEEYTNPIHLETGGKHTLRYYSVDNVGNAEKIGSISSNSSPSDKGEKKKNVIVLTVDDTPPTTKHIAEGVEIEEESGLILASPGSKFFLHPTDETSGIKATYYQIDNAPYQLYKGGVSMQNLPDGEHTLTYYSEDKVSNKEQAQKYEFFLDKSAPILTSDVLGDRFLVNDQIYFSGRTKLKLIAIDNKSGIKELKYSIDGGKFKDYDTPFYLPRKTGQHTVRYYAIDRLNNSTGKDNYKYSAKKIFVDLVGPTLRHNIQGKFFKTRETLFLGPQSQISLSAIDNESGLQYIAYAIDHKQEETRYTKPFTVKGDGKHLIEFFGYDNVNNRNVKEFYVIVDETPPQSAPRFSIDPIGYENSVPVYPSYVELYLSAKDKTTGNDKIQYTLNNQAPQIYTRPLKNFPKGENKLKITAIDKLGNQQKQDLVFIIK